MAFNLESSSAEGKAFGNTIVIDNPQRGVIRGQVRFQFSRRELKPINASARCVNSLLRRLRRTRIVQEARHREEKLAGRASEKLQDYSVVPVLRLFIHPSHSGSKYLLGGSSSRAQQGTVQLRAFKAFCTFLFSISRARLR